MKILNSLYEDYHVHSSNYSDAMNTIDEIVNYAGNIGMKKLVFTDHSQFNLNKCNIWFRNWRSHTKRWENVFNDIDVSFGVEWDLINESGDCCFDIQGIQPDFCILSCHPDEYEGDVKNITKAYINAIKRYHNIISFLWHLNMKGIVEYIDLELIIKLANEYKIPIEFNSSYFARDKLDKVDQLLWLSDQIYVNWDIHCLSDFSKRKIAFDYLEEKWYI
jgi:histidinol phosphatase-like PHP family hydrolase